jgi:hypothetical protein
MKAPSTKSRRVQVGDVFRIPTSCGPCSFQYVQRQATFGQLVSVFEDAEPTNPTAAPRLFDIFFPISVASKEPETEYIGRFDLPSQYLSPVPLKYPLRNLSTNDVVGWMVVEDEETRRVAELADDQQHYPYAFAVNWDELARLYCLRWKPTMPYPT